MEVVRIVKTVTNDRISLDLPTGFSGQEVEIIVLTKNTVNSKRKSLKGKLHQYAKPELINQESHAWKNAIEKKYGDR